MTRKNRTLIIAFSAVALLVTAVILVKRPEGETEPAETPVPPAETILLTDFDTGSLRTLKIENPEGILSLSSMDGLSWFVKDSPADYRIKEMLLRSMVSNLSSIRGVVVEEDEADLTLYGLDTPEATTRMADNSGRESVVIFGNSNPSGNGRYASLPGSSRVFLVAASQANKAFWSLSELREDRLPEITLEAITSFEMKSGNTVFRTEPYTGELGPYRPLAASMDIVTPWQGRKLLEDHLFQELMASSPPPSRVSKYPEKQPEDHKALGLGPGADRLRIETVDGGLYDLEIGIDDGLGRRYAKEASYGDTVFLVEESDLGLLNLDPYKLTNQFVFLAGIDRVQEIRIEGVGPPRLLSIEKLGDMGDDSDDVFRIDGYVIGEKDFKKAYQAVIGLLYEGVARNPAADKAPEITMRFTHVDAAVPPKTVSFLHYDQTYYLAGAEGEVSEFIIGRYQLDQMFDTLTSAIEAGP